jgi:purine-binding chemotaxis protein CheW
MSASGDVAITAEFLDSAAIARILARREAAADSRLVETEQVLVPVLRWTIGDEQYAIPLRDVREVSETRQITRLPGAPAALRGVTAWRGEVLNLADPAPVLGASGDAEAGTKMLVLRTVRARLALQVTQVVGVASVLPALLDDFEGLTRFVEGEDGDDGFAIVATERLVSELLVRGHQNKG